MGEMRISGLGALTMGMILLNGAETREEDATHHVARALSIACGPWLEGRDAKVLGEKLAQAGWDKFDDTLYAKAGSWGTVAVALQHANGERHACRIHMRTNEEPWTTIEATTAAQAWVASIFPCAEKQRSIDTIVNGQRARTTHWRANGAKIMLTAFQAKQVSPDSDFILEIEAV